MLGKILVPIDSIEWDNTLRAVKSAMSFAEGCSVEGGMELVFLHVYNTKSRVPISERERIMELKKKEIDEEFKIIREMAEERGLKNITTISRTGTPANEIINTAEEKKADMIVMGSGKLHDKTAAGKVHKFFYGSVTEEVTHGTPCSVLISRPKMGFNKIMLPIDSKEWDNTLVGIEKALDIASSCQIEDSPEIILMHILEESPNLPDIVKEKEFESSKERVEKEFDEIKEMSKKRGITNFNTIIKEKSDKELDKEIAETAVDLDVDLIVMGSGRLHDRSVKGRIKKFFFGSVTENVMHEAPSSILIARPSKYPEEE